MAVSIQKIAVLTSGGDAPGMNAAIRGTVYAALHRGIGVYGILEGYRGLLNGEYRALSYDDVANILPRGGTFLRTVRCPEFATPEGVKKAAEKLSEMQVDALVVIGGDGSFRGALELSRFGIPVVGIPATIDNDITCTDYTIGFDTAMNTAMEAIDRIRDTTYSHDRCSIIEVMGRHAGYIAYHTALASGAEVMLLPEEAFDFEAQVAAPLRAWYQRGKRDFIVVLAEGAKVGDTLAASIEEAIGIKPTFSMLGYIQRGGSPSLRDRSTALRMGEKAVEQLYNGAESCIIAEHKGALVPIPMDAAFAMEKSLDVSDIKTGKILTHG